MTTAEVRVLSVIPPMTQLNTPYPSTAYLTGFLRSRDITAAQEDLALALVLALFTPEGLDGLRADARRVAKPGPVIAHFLQHFDAYRATIGPVIRFLQGGDSTLAHRINARTLLPEGPRLTSTRPSRRSTTSSSARRSTTRSTRRSL